VKYKRVRNRDGSIEYRIDGTFEAFFYDRLKKQVVADIDAGEASFFSFDLSKTNRIDSMAISILVLAGKYNAGKGMKLKVKKPTDLVKEIIRAADLKFIEYI
jgi:hypothetical protein